MYTHNNHTCTQTQVSPHLHMQRTLPEPSDDTNANIHTQTHTYILTYAGQPSPAHAKNYCCALQQGDDNQGTPDRRLSAYVVQGTWIEEEGTQSGDPLL